MQVRVRVRVRVRARVSARSCVPAEASPSIATMGASAPAATRAPASLACVAREHRVPPTASRMAASPEEASRESQKPAPAALIAWG